MAYDIYLGTVHLPVTPESLKVKIGGQNKTVNLINDGQVNILKSPKLTEVEFDAILPGIDYPWSGTDRLTVSDYLAYLENFKVSKKPFQLIVVRTLPSGMPIYNTNLKVSLESYTLKESHDTGFDTVASIKLKQYRPYGTNKAKIKQQDSEDLTVTVESKRDTSSAPSAKTYTVKKGDCLMAISKKMYGNSGNWEAIYEANKDTIGGNPNLIYPGQTFSIPDK